MKAALRGPAYVMRVMGVAVTVLLLLLSASAPTQASEPVVPATASKIEGQWKLITDDSDDILSLWHEAVRERMKRDARRAPSNSPMAQPANPGQHINLPLFLGTFKRVDLRSTAQYIVIEQRQFREPERRRRDDRKFVAPEVISREINLNPQATSVSLREAARRPPTMFIGGWEKDALVIETTTDEGLLIEERWRITRDDDQDILQRQVRLRSSIWGERIFKQQFAKAEAS